MNTPPPASDEDFRQALLERAAEAEVAVPSDAVEPLREYYALLSRWNRRINLTALPLEGFPLKTLDRLILEPLAASPYLPAGAKQWIDLGSGGGSPAIPLKIVFPSLALSMVESRGRKAAFLREAVRTLKLSQTTVLTVRLDALPSILPPLPPDVVDLITARAVRIDERVCEIVARVLSPRGLFLYFGSVADLPRLQPPLALEGSIPLFSGRELAIVRRT